ncbi:hypothetical protein VOLCADRAFT_96231 [Volvox carteri f. nagariensis]|uniref:Uncharacterized protein n=1 Tax=Volvox carteri f. nagariensis TaxID=3068 RepID=D8U9K1_VOLCA|nr:uncharacterized protein VOLCADRAFT_96231 [Volvox carteri f. nagariensis]EFJ43656.1 hypothetical protein VOLCADRAFT_96231 [Volvox carteri f. nagariensis]|eukprot:XP_002955356.1 hypothetical protein VOLCADRAFT_96231 [Volvox carteri f. nagariensis]
MAVKQKFVPSYTSKRSSCSGSTALAGRREGACLGLPPGNLRSPGKTWQAGLGSTKEKKAADLDAGKGCVHNRKLSARVASPSLVSYKPAPYVYTGDMGQAATGSSRTYMELGAASWLGIQTMIRDTVAKVDISVCEFVQIVRGLNKMEDGGTAILQQSRNMGARSTSRSTSSVSVKELEKL